MANIWGTLIMGSLLNFLSLRGVFGHYDDAVIRSDPRTDDDVHARRLHPQGALVRYPAEAQETQAKAALPGGRGMSGALMKIEGLDKYFGGLHAVNSVSFEVPRGTIKAVIGPNGAGKTTMFNMIAGYFPPSSGSVFFNDQLITGMKPYQAASAGLLRTFQNLKVCGNLSVIDNVLLGRHTKGRAGFAAGMFATRSSRIEEKRAVDEVMPLLDWLGLTPKKDTAVAGLSFGEQRAVELARALAPDPLMLLLDEPRRG